MPGVPSVGTADFNNNLYQPEPQMQVEEEQMPIDISQQMPVDYSTELEGTKKSGSLAGPILCGLALLGIAGFGGYKLGKKGAKNVANSVDSEIVKQYERTQKALEEIEKLADEKLNDAWYKKAGKKLAQKIKEILAPLKKGTEATADETKEAAEKVADEAKKAADDTAKNAA